MAEIGSRKCFLKDGSTYNMFLLIEAICLQSGKSITQNTMRELLEQCPSVGKGKRAGMEGVRAKEEKQMQVGGQVRGGRRGYTLVSVCFLQMK